jgi:hypothetical protein
MYLAERPPPSRIWLAALPFALLLIPRSEEPRTIAYTETMRVVQTAPAPTPCDDPYPGLWVARSHRSEHGDWHEYTLEIKRHGDKLHGELTLLAWPGEEADAHVPECADGSAMVTRYDDIPVEITLNGTEIRLDAGHAQVHVDATCNPVGDYSPDHFVGTLDAHAGSMDMRNSDDGGYAHKRPYEFVRMTCW